MTTIGFDPVNYVVSEDAGQVTFMFGVLSGTLRFTVDIVFMTANDSAFEGKRIIVKIVLQSSHVTNDF